MFSRFVMSLRTNTTLFTSTFIAFTGAAIIGYMTVDAGSSTPVVWLAAMWVMLGVGTLLVITGLVDAVSAMLGKQ